MADAAVVKELYSRMNSLSPDQQAVVQELHRRMSTPAVPGMEKIGALPGPVAPPTSAVQPIDPQAVIPSESPLTQGSRMAWEAKYGMPPSDELGSGTPGLGIETLAPSLLTGPGAVLTSMGAGYGASRGAKALGAPEWASDLIGGAVGVGTGALYGRMLPGVLPSELSQPTTKFLNMLPGKNYGDAANEYLHSLGPTIEPVTPMPAGKGTGTKYGGPAPTQYSPPATPIKVSPGPFTPLTPEGQVEPITPVAPEPFKISPRTAKLIKGTQGTSQIAPVGRGSAARSGINRALMPDAEAEESPISPIVTPSGGTQPAALPNAPSGTVTIPPVAGRPIRYNEMAVKGGAALQDMTVAKDMRIASNLKQEGVTPEQWMALDNDVRDAYAKRLGYKAFGMGGRLGRQTHAEGEW